MVVLQYWQGKFYELYTIRQNFPTYSLCFVFGYIIANNEVLHGSRNLVIIYIAGYSINCQLWAPKIDQLVTSCISTALGTFQLGKPNFQSKHTSIFEGKLCVKLKKCTKLIMEHQYVFNRTTKFIVLYFLYIAIANIPRKYNLFPLVPYKATYHMLLNGIHTGYITDCGKQKLYMH